jgi:hypothetical protein
MKIDLFLSKYQFHVLNEVFEKVQGNNTCMVRCMPLQLLHDHDPHINVYIYMIKLVNTNDKKTKQKWE